MARIQQSGGTRTSRRAVVLAALASLGAGAGLVLREQGNSAGPSPEPDSAGSPRPAGDNRATPRTALPPEVFRPAGSGRAHDVALANYVDITKVEEQLGAPAGTNAVPNDPGRDTARAMNHVLDWMAEQQRILGRSATTSPETSYVLYVPSGTYVLRSSVRYSGTPIETSDGLSPWVNMRIVGEGRERTVLVLADSAPGFGADQRNAVLDFTQSATFANESAQTVLRNITIDTGANNPGAIGVAFYGANSASISNVTIRSGDGSGRVGLHLPIGIASGYIANLTVEGFEHGILMEEYHFINPLIEHVTLTGQRESGISVRNSTPVLRSVRSINSCPALRITGPGAHVVMLDSELVSGEPGRAAIEVSAPAHLFLRAITTAGYGAAVRWQGRDRLPTGQVDEFVSDIPLGESSASARRSLDLEVRDVPEVVDAGAADTVVVSSPSMNSTIGERDDTAELQAAIESGRSTVLLPRQVYRVSRTIRVPATVRRIDGLFCTMVSTGGQPIFEVSEMSDTVLTVQDFNRVAGGILIVHSRPRPLSLHTVRAGGPGGGGAYRNRVRGPNGDLYLSNVSGLRATSATFRRQQVWARWINSEMKTNTNFAVGQGGVVCVINFKTEGGAPAFTVERNGVLEVLGGLLNQYSRSSFDDGSAPDVAFVLRGGQASIVATSSGPAGDSMGFAAVIHDSTQEPAEVLEPRQLPGRWSRPGQWVLPLYDSSSTR